MLPGPTQTLSPTPPRVEDPTFVFRKVPILGESPTSSILDPESLAGTVSCDDVIAPRMQEAVGAYRIVREVGIGGMGVVYEAIDTRLKRRVAIKMIRGGVGTSRDAIRRFQTEAEAVAQTQHPNIVQIYEVGWHEGQPFVALEYLPGGTLFAKAANKPQPPQEAAVLVRTIAEAMHHAHTQGVIHRDLKPGNILFTADGTPKVTDFGAARLLQDGPDSNAPFAALTKVGEVIGTPQYMAPEQARGTPGGITTKIDVYALGAVLYHLLTGRPPHDGPESFDVLNAVVRNDPVAPRRLVPNVPRDLETICLKALEKHPSNRYGSAREIADDLGRYLDGDSILAKPDPGLLRIWRKACRNPMIAGLIAVIILVALAGFTGVVWQWREAIRESERAGYAEKSLEWALTEARKAGQAATRSAELARTEEAKAREESRLKDVSLYRSRVSEIALMLENGDYERARTKLEESANTSPGHTDHRHWEWYYLNRLGTNYLWRASTDPGEDNEHWTHSIAVSPDAKFVAYSCGNPYFHPGHDQFVSATLVIADTATGNVLHVWRDYLPESAQQLVWRDSSTIVAATPGRGFRVIRFPDAEIQHDWGRLTHDKWTEPMSHCRISPDGRYVYRLTDTSEVAVFDTIRGAIVRRFTFDAPITSLPIMTQPRGAPWRIVVTTRNDARVIDPVAGKELRTLPVRFCSFATVDRTGNRMALFHDGRDNPDTRLEYWDLATGKREWSLRHPKLYDYSRIELSPEGDKLVELANCDVALRVFDCASGTLDCELRGHTNRILGFEFSPDGRHIATASNDASIRIWNLKDGSEALKLRGHSTGTRAVAFDPNGWRLYTGGMDHNAFAWDLTRGCPDGTRLPFAASMNDSWGGAFSGGLWCSTDGLGRYLDTSEGKMLVFDPATYTPVRVVRMADLERRGERTSTDYALTADGRFLFGSRMMGLPRPCLWDTCTGALLHEFQSTEHGRIIAAAISPDGCYAAACIIVRKSPEVTGREFFIWNVLTGEVHYHAALGQFSYGALAFDSANRLYCGLASNDSAENGLHIIDVRKLTFSKFEFGCPTIIRHIVFSNNNRWLATVDHCMIEGGQKIRLHDLTGVHRGWMRRNVGPVTGLGFSPDGKRLASVRFDDSLVLYDVESDFEAFHKKVPTSRIADYAFPARVAFSPDGRSLMMNHSTGQISVWRTELNNAKEDLRSQNRRREADAAAYAYHLRAAHEFREKASVGFRFHAEWLGRLTPPNDFLKHDWEKLKP